MKRLKYFLIIFLISSPFWWGINLLEENLKDFFLLQYSQPASLSAQILPLPAQASEKFTADELSTIEIAAQSAFSVKIDREGKEQILFQKNPARILPVASLTKLMTAWVVFEYPEYYDLSQTIRVSEKAIAQPGDFGLSAGQRVSVRDLLYSTLIESSNDAAFAIAEALVSDTEVFVDLMNLETKERMGLKNTYFINSTGLEPRTGADEENLLTNYSTAEDLFELTKNILFHHPEILEISNQKSALIFGDYLAVNTNAILSDSTMGGKTGWTPSAGGCFLLVLKDGEAHIINIILGAASPEARFSEMKKLINHINILTF